MTRKPISYIIKYTDFTVVKTFTKRELMLQALEVVKRDKKHKPKVQDAFIDPKKLRVEFRDREGTVTAVVAWSQVSL